MLFALDICVNKKVPPTYSVHWGLNPISTPQKHNPLFFFFAKPPLKSANYPSPLFRRFIVSKKWFFHASPPPHTSQKKMGFFSELS